MCIPWNTLSDPYKTITFHLTNTKHFLNLFYHFKIEVDGGSDSKESACNVGELGLSPGMGRSPGEGHGNPLQYFCLEKGMLTHSSILAWRIHMDRGVWQTTVHGVAKSQPWLSDFTFTFHFYALEKEMATHSSVLAWRIPGMRSHWVGRDWSDLAAASSSGKEPTCQCRRHKRHRFDPWVRKICWRRVWQPTPVFLPKESHGQRSLVGYSP